MPEVICGNNAYVLKKQEHQAIEGVEYLHAVIEIPRGSKVRANEERSFYIWRPQPSEYWMPIPVRELDRLKGYHFDTSIPPCETEELQARHINDMSLLVDEDVVLPE